MTRCFAAEAFELPFSGRGIHRECAATGNKEQREIIQIFRKFTSNSAKNVAMGPTPLSSVPASVHDNGE
jgi:hypothetical protein